MTEALVQPNPKEENETNGESEPLDIDKVRIWARHLAAETYGQFAAVWYLCPNTVAALAQELNTWSGLVGLVGQQGIGKTSALLALYWGKAPGMKGDMDDRVLFKWRDENALFSSLLEGSHELCSEFIPGYARSLFAELNSLHRKRSRDSDRYLRFIKYVDSSMHDRYDGPSPDIHWAESQVGRAKVTELRREAWLNTFEFKRVILIDTPDYSKTDKRRLDRDLEGIYWFWNNLAHRCGPSIVVAMQEEMFRGHFFLGKMRKVKLLPLSADQMLRAYRLRFDTFEPFTEEALRLLARMSRGIFRRFKNYISETLDLWASEGSHGRIYRGIVERAVPVERIAEDMELDLKPLFPKHSELCVAAVRVILDLEEEGPQKQTQLTTKFGLKPFETSRLLGKLQSAGHVRRPRAGTDKIVEAINPAQS